MGLYKFNENTFEYESVNLADILKKERINLFKWFLVLGPLFYGYGLFVGYEIKQEIGEKIVDENLVYSKHDLIIGGKIWKDSIFIEYQKKAELYLNRPEFKGTPIKAEMLRLAAENAYDSTGILLPVELALAQCQWESGMGLKGRSPKNNPYNIGEYDTGTVIWFDSTFEGIQAYYYYMCNNYLKCKTLEELFKDFTNCDGYRYASGDYESHVPKQYYYIKKWIKKRYENLVE